MTRSFGLFHTGVLYQLLTMKIIVSNFQNPRTDSQTQNMLSQKRLILTSKEYRRLPSYGIQVEAMCSENGGNFTALSLHTTNRVPIIRAKMSQTLSVQEEVREHV